MDITIIGFERVPEDILKAIKGTVERKFGANVKVEKGIFLPPAEIRAGQIEARAFLAPVVARSIGGYGLGVTERDIYVEGKEFVLGLAVPEMKSAVISLYRIGINSRKLKERRAVKLAIHDLGHAIYNLPHCENKKCAMYPTEEMRELDAKQESFCRGCLDNFSKAKERMKKEAETRNFFEEVKELWKRRGIKAD